MRVLVAAVLNGTIRAVAAQETDFDYSLRSFDAGSFTATSEGTLSQGRPLKSVVAAKEEPAIGNPLWTILVSELSETHARPIFSPSRRPPVPAVLAALPAQPIKPASAVKPEPGRPPLTLLGTIVGESLEIGVFINEASHDVIRIKVGEAHDVWTLSAISGRGAIFQKQGYRAATLAFPAVGVEAATSIGGPSPNTFVSSSSRQPQQEDPNDRREKVSTQSQNVGRTK